MHETPPTYVTVSLLGLVNLPGKEDQFGLVLLEPLGVDLQRLQRAVPPPVVHGYPNLGGKLPRDASTLENIASSLRYSKFGFC